MPRSYPFLIHQITGLHAHCTPISYNTNPSTKTSNLLNPSPDTNMKNTGKSFKTGSTNKSDARRDRKSATGLNGSPKKGGHGGKYTWAGDGYSKAEIGFQSDVVDVNDPNFEGPEEIAETA